MELKKKQFVTSTLALSLLFMPQGVSQTNAAKGATQQRLQKSVPLFLNKRKW